MTEITISVYRLSSGFLDGWWGLERRSIKETSRPAHRAETRSSRGYLLAHLWQGAYNSGVTLESDSTR
jgi:hypothetical protein